MQTISVRGSGGLVFDMDVSPGGIRRELFIGQVRRGDVVVLVDGVGLGFDETMAFIDLAAVAEPVPATVEPKPATKAELMARAVEFGLEIKGKPTIAQLAAVIAEREVELAAADDEGDTDDGSADLAPALDDTDD